MFIYASARSGDYESCTPTLSFARARLNRDGIEGSNCEHNIAKDYCPYCYAGDLAAEKKLLSEEEFCHDQFDTSKLQLKQVRNCERNSNTQEVYQIRVKYIL